MTLTPTRRCASVPCLATLTVDPGGAAGASLDGGELIRSPSPRSAFAPSFGAAAGRAPSRSASAVCLPSLGVAGGGGAPSPRTAAAATAGHRRQCSLLWGGGGGGGAAAAARGARRLGHPAGGVVVAAPPMAPVGLFHDGTDGTPRPVSGAGGVDPAGGGGVDPLLPARPSVVMFGGGTPGAPPKGTNSVVTTDVRGVTTPVVGAATADAEGTAAVRDVAMDACDAAETGGGDARPFPARHEGEVAPKAVNQERRSLLAAVTMAVSLLGLPGRAAGVTELLASISLRGPLASRHPLFAGLSIAGDVASEALSNVSCPPEAMTAGLFHDCTPHSVAMIIHVVVDVLNLSPY